MVEIELLGTLAIFSYQDGWRDKGNPGSQLEKDLNFLWLTKAGAETSIYPYSVEAQHINWVLNRFKGKIVADDWQARQSEEGVIY